MDHARSLLPLPAAACRKLPLKAKPMPAEKSPRQCPDCDNDVFQARSDCRLACTDCDVPVPIPEGTAYVLKPASAEFPTKPAEGAVP